MKRQSLELIALGAILSGPAFAQSFNIDCNVTFGVPSGSHGAAAMQPGTWNLVTFGAAGTPLLDTTGAATSVTYTQLMGSGDFDTDNAGTTGDDEALMDDLIDIGGGTGATAQILIEGLADGDYEVYAYAWAPDSAGYRTDVTVTPSSSPTQQTGGSWPGMQTLGITYSFFDDVVIAGGAVLTIDAATAGGFGSLNGLQIVGDSGPPSSVGMNYCFTNPNSTGSTAAISATGSANVSAQNLSLQSSNMPPNVVGIFYYGNNMIAQPFGDGIRCVAGVIQRLPFNSADSSGTMTEPSVFSLPMPNLAIAPGVLGFQSWFRDPSGPGGTGFNLSNGLMITFMP